MQTDSAQHLAASILRSITPLTGALIGGLCVAVPVIAFGIADPRATVPVVLPFALILGTLGAVVGAAVGRDVALRVRKSRWAGPVDWRAVSLVLVVVLPTLATVTVRSVFRIERLNTPRVIASTGAIVRSAGGPVGAGWAASGELIWKSGSSSGQPIEWNGRRVLIEATDDALEVRAGDQALPPVDLAGLSYVWEVYGVTAMLAGGTSQWLVLLTRLRPTSRRELLVIFDPHGTVAHLELLDRPLGGEPRTILWIEGSPPDPQQLGVNLGVPLRYAVTPTGRAPSPGN